MLRQNVQVERSIPPITPDVGVEATRFESPLIVPVVAFVIVNLFMIYILLSPVSSDYIFTFLCRELVGVLFFRQRLVVTPSVALLISTAWLGIVLQRGYPPNSPDFL